MDEHLHPEQAATASTAVAKRPWYRRRIPVACAAGATLLAGAFAAGIPVGAATASAEASATTAAAQTATAPTESTQGESTQGGSTQGGSTQTPWGGTSSGGTGTTVPTIPDGSAGGASGSVGSANAEATEASADESTGVVIIETVLGYQDGEAAGTGLVLTSDGLILTNNHVVEGSTEISVTIATTGETYTATVVGTDAEDDVAVLQLEGASDLATVAIDDDGVSAGDAVTAVGNAEGGGVLMAADGSITAVDASVTTTASATTDGETLDGMIEIAADVVSGDSGGAVLDAEGEVVGVTTAASSGSSTTIAYAIPVEEALGIVDEILAGDESNGATIGYPAFLGVQIAGATSSAYGQSGQTTTTAGAAIAGVIEGTPAASAGIVAGDVVTAVDGVAVADSESLSELLAGYEPGDAVTITWTDAAGASETAVVTLIEGPAA
ncbi:S1C family serine protease [Microbacterium sp. NPDC055683]